MGDADLQATPTPAPLKRRERHPALHFVILVFNIVVALACLTGAGVLVIGQRVVNDTKKTAALEAPGSTKPATVSIVTPGPSTNSSPDTGVADTGLTLANETTTTEAFPVADPQAQNFLITGADNNPCSDPGSAQPVPDRTTLGERSDTIMVMRVDPSSGRAAVLSFPRDLWVKIDGTNGSNRINSAYSVNNPQKLINTIYNNFGIVVNHYIQIDFCAFKTLVNAVGGVSVYFEYPARDTHTGLDVPVSNACYTLNGDAALAYARSRHYQYLNPATGQWTEDPAADYGRISRQQDFLRRAVAKVLSNGYSIKLARSLIDVATKYVVTDPTLTIDKQLQFAGVLKRLNPQDIQTYQIEGVGTVISGAAVIKPRLTSDNMKAILAIFRGQAQLATGPTQVFDSTNSSLPETSTSAPTSTSIGSATSTTVIPSTTSTVPASTLPEVNATNNNKGIFPPADKICP